MDKKLDEVLENSIAIIGMAGRFPGANSIENFWQNITLGKESITFFSDEELVQEGISQHEINDPNYIKAKGVMQDIDKFDAKFFGILPKDAVILDPQHRVLLECVWSALEDAGYPDEKNAGRTGVFAGCGFNSYYPKVILHNEKFAEEITDVDVGLGNANDFISTRISYKFNLTGPSVTVQTACSTSLVAVTLAVNSLLDYQCDMAVAGGASAYFPIKSGYHYKKEFILSKDGHCRAFDAEGSGTVFGMGAGVVILKRLQDALKDHDHIYAVIRGAAMNNDGGNKIGFTAPSQQGQREVIEEAQTLAQIDPETIHFIEAHATGTPIGDPIEIAALTEAFRAKTDKKNFCALGTLKANVGHLDAAAGVAGLIKAVLVLQHKKIPPAVNFKNPNPKINFAESPFYVPTSLEDWESKGTRRAAISSFGVGGTNAHVILEEAPIYEKLSKANKSNYLISLSAKTDEALKQKIKDLEKWLQKKEENFSLEEISYTLNIGRKHFEKKWAVNVASLTELKESLRRSEVNDNEIVKQYLQGEKINWEKLHENESHRRISLPTYPFERVRYWVPQSVNKEEKTDYYFYHSDWIPSPLPQEKFKKFKSENEHATCLVLGKDTATFSFFNVIYNSLKKSEEEYKKIFEGKPIPKIIFINPGTPYDINNTFYAVFYLTRALLATKPTQVVYIIYHAVSDDPFAVALSALFKTISMEYPIIQGRLLISDGISEEAIVTALASEEAEIKYLHNLRYTKALNQIMIGNEKSVFKQQGVYLITGGARGLGWKIATFLATKYEAKLILVGRSPLNSDMKQKLQQINAKYEQGNIAVLNDAKKIFENAHQYFGRLDGIFHCAGVLHDSLLVKKSDSEIEEVLAAKIYGTLNIAEFSKNEELDFFVLFSSIASLFGNLGQSDYAYANAFLNAFSTNKHKVTAIDWPPWEEGGMELSQTARDWMKKNFSSSPLTTDEGLTILEKVVALNPDQVVVLKGDKEKIEKYLSHTSNNKPENETTTEIIDKLIKILIEISSLPRSDIEPNKSLFEIGLDSIVLLQLISKVEKDFGVTLENDMQEILMQPTLDNIAKKIAKTDEDDSSSEQVVKL